MVLWNPAREVELSDAMVHDLTRYTPYAGRRITGWPEIVLRRGVVIVENGRMLAPAGSGAFLARTGGPAAMPSGRLAPEMDPAQNFGAKLL